MCTPLPVRASNAKNEGVADFFLTLNARKNERNGSQHNNHKQDGMVWMAKGWREYSFFLRRYSSTSLFSSLLFTFAE